MVWYWESNECLNIALFDELKDNYLRNVITDCTFNNFLELMCSSDISVLLNISLFVKHGMKKETQIAKYVLSVLDL